MPHLRSDGAPDAVIIGAGHNGLVAANILADAGWDVVICEATPFIGGAIRSAEVTCPGYVSDLFSAFYPLAAASPVLAGLDLEAHGVQWRHAPSVLAQVFPDDRCAVLSRDIDSTAASVGQFAPADAERWRQMVQQWTTIEPFVMQALFSPFPPLRGAGNLARNLGVAGTARLARMAVMPVRRFTEEWFAGGGARMLIAGNARHADLSPDSAGSAVYGWLLAMVGQTHGFPVPAGGSGQLAAAMERRLHSCGGTIRVNAPVDEIVIGNNTALGVRLADGELIRARRAVLADVTAPILYRDLVRLDRLPARLGTDLEHFEWDTPTLKMDWALSGSSGGAIRRPPTPVRCTSEPISTPSPITPLTSRASGSPGSRSSSSVRCPPLIPRGLRWVRKVPGPTHTCRSDCECHRPTSTATWTRSRTASKGTPRDSVTSSRAAVYSHRLACRTRTPISCMEPSTVARPSSTSS